MAELQLSVVTPQGTVTEQSAESVTIPTADGEITVLPNHIPLVSVLKPGTITARMGEKATDINVTSGFVQVGSGGVVILAESAGKATNAPRAGTRPSGKAGADG